MASVLILSLKGNGIPIALRLASEGHEVAMWFKDRKSRNSWRGFDNPFSVSSPYTKDYDLILSDMVGSGDICDELKQKGKIVIGGGVFNDKLELDRSYGSKVINKLTEAKLPNTVDIKTSKDLLSHLRASTTPQVIKPLNNCSVDLTLVGVDDMNKSLISIAEKWGKDLTPCIVQEKIKNGIEISTEGWFNGEDFIKPFNHTFEKKRLIDNDKGPQTGCSGCVVYPSEGDRLTDILLKPLVPLLKKVNYLGPIDVNCIMVGDDIYFLEFTTRFGYDAIQAWTELLKISLYDFLYNLATRGGDLKVREEYIDSPSISVRMSVPPYPNHEDMNKWKGVQVLNLSKGAERHVWLADVMKKHNDYVLAGIDGVIGCATARGDDIQECQRRVYRTIKNVVINQDVQYRSDIGKGVAWTKSEFDRWCQSTPSSISNDEELEEWQKD